MITAMMIEKGGPGKTTFAVHVAGWLARAGKAVVLVDGDRQGSASLWVDSRKAHNMPTPAVERQVGPRLQLLVEGLARRYDDVVVDIGAGEGDGMAAVLRVADTVIAPVQPNGLDVWTLDLLEELADSAREDNPDLVVKAVLNRAPAHRRSLDVSAAQKEIGRYEVVEDSGIVIRERRSIRRAVPAGLLVDEFPPVDKEGTAEMAAIYRLVYGENPPSISLKRRKG